MREAKQKIVERGSANGRPYLILKQGKYFGAIVDWFGKGEDFSGWYYTGKKAARKWAEGYK